MNFSVYVTTSDNPRCFFAPLISNISRDKNMNKILITTAIICVFATSSLLASEKDVACDKCAKDSEYSWNPNNKYVTPRLQRFYSLDDQITQSYSTNDYDLAKVY